MNTNDAKPDTQAIAPDPDDTWSDADGMDDTDVQDPEFAALLGYLEALAVKVIERVRAKHGPEPSPDQDVQTETSAERTAQEPGTNAYDEFHGIPRYDIE